MNVVLSCAGHKLRLILRRVRFFWFRAGGFSGAGMAIIPCAVPRFRRFLVESARQSPARLPEQDFFRTDYISEGILGVKPCRRCAG